MLSTPALAALREAHPALHIALLTTPGAVPVVRGGSLVDEVLTSSRHIFNPRHPSLSEARAGAMLARRLRAGAYDTILFLHHLTTQAGALKLAALAAAAGSSRRAGLENGRGFFLTDRLTDDGFGARHQAQYWLDLAALLGADPRPRPAQVAITSDDRAWAAEQLSPPIPAAVRRDDFVVIHAGSGGYSRARRWDPAKFAQVADRLVSERQLRIVLVGGPDDDSKALKQALRSPALDLSGQTSIGQLAAVLERASVFVGADSGVMHVAAAAGAPVAAIFGPSNHEAWGPWTPDGRSLIVRSGPECSPCSYVGHSVGLREGCAARTCMKLIASDQVIEAALKLLDGGGIAPVAVPSAPVRWPRTISILGLPVSAITYAEWLEQIGAWVGETPRRVHHVCTINPEMVMIAQRDPNFQHILQRADLTVPDGVGLLWAARRQGRPLPERVTGSDGVPIIAARAAQEGWRLFLLGAAPGVAETAARVLSERYPCLKIAGVYSGSPAPEEEAELCERVNASGADVLFVAYGAPEQDKWIARNSPRLRVAIAMGVGGSFDFIAGILPRAPAWMQRAGLEWLYRLYLQPRRIRRMLRLPRFVLSILTERTSGHER